jgi:hypothetical protein
MLVILIIGIVSIFQPASAQRKKNRKTEPVTMAQKTVPVVQNIVLADKGLTAYRIVIPSSATIHERKAAEVLQDYLLQISGTALPVLTADKKGSRYEILLGQNDRLDRLNTGISFNELGSDGFVIMTDSMRLIIAGGNEKGTLFGVYTFLEKYLGCRMYSPRVKIIPKKEKIVLETLKDKQSRLSGSEILTTGEPGTRNTLTGIS